MRTRTCGLLVSLLFITSCASLLDVGTIRYPRLVQQEDPRGCAIAAVAMAAGRTYVEVDQARVRLGISLEQNNGLYASDVIALAGSMGVRLTPIQHFNFVSDRGLLAVTLVPNQTVHMVYVYRGMVYDPLKLMGEPYVAASSGWTPLYFLLQR